MKFSGILRLAAALFLVLPARLTAQAPRSGELDGFQWAVFKLSPENAILTVDGTQTYPVRDGVLQLLLVPGVHKYFCESPYYESVAGEFELDKDEKENLTLNLVPVFGYVSVNSTQKKADIMLDGEKIGRGKAGSGRVMAGPHSLLLVRDAVCLYRLTFNLDRGERKVINIGSSDLHPVPMDLILAESGITAGSEPEDEDGIAAGWGGVNVHSNIAGASVIVNGIERGTSPCIIKPLRDGQPCRVTLKYHGFKDVTKMVKIKGGEVADIEIRLKKRK